MEDKIASDCISTAAATCGCKNFITMQIRFEHVRKRCTPQEYHAVHAAQKTVDYQAEVFLHQSKQYMF